MATAAIVVLATVLAACETAGRESDADTAPAAVAPTREPTLPPGPATSAPSPTPTPTPTPARTLPPPLPDDFPLALELVADGLSSPVFATAPPDDDRLFVVERDGRIRVVEEGRVRDEPFLDIAGEVRAGNEQGLLGLAFHPDYSRNGRLFVSYTAEPDGHSRLEEYASDADGARADASSVQRLLTVAQPHRWHNGGMIAFAPDGRLVVAFGDGGGADDPEDNGQDPTTLLATLVRIDVDGADSDRAYTIPADNPFADGIDGAPEVWAYGLRNPWRFAIDPVTDLLYVADVGEYEREELNVVPYAEPGPNFGWPLVEGSLCRDGDDAVCASEELVDPVLEYERDGVVCAIIGGFPYRGAAVPELHGTYFYGDHCAGWIRSLRMREGEPTERHDWSDQLPRIPEMSSFGVDADGELYVLSLQGSIHRLTAGG